VKTCSMLIGGAPSVVDLIPIDGMLLGNQRPNIAVSVMAITMIEVTSRIGTAALF
jgi:hypothetical protein